MESALFAATRQPFIRSTKTWERLSIDIVGPKPMTGKAKTKTFSQWWMSLVGFISSSLSGTPRLVASSIVFRHFSLSSGTPGFIHSDRGRQFVSTEFPNFCLQNGVATSKTTPYFPQGNGQNERYNGSVRKAVQCLLHSTYRPPSDWECVLQSALSSSRTLIITATKESPHDRFVCFKRGELLIRPFSSAPWLRADTPAYLRKFVEAKDQAPVVPVQISEVISLHLVRVSFGDGRVDTVSPSDLSRRPPDVDNEETISQSGGQYKDKKTNVDIGTLVPDIGTECEPPKSVEPVKESQISLDSPAPTLRRSARNRKPPTYLGDFVLTMN